MLTKLLWIVLALIAGWWLWKGFVRLRSGDDPRGSRSDGRQSARYPASDSASASGDSSQGTPQPSGPSQEVAPAAQALVACAYCGAWSGRAFALERGGHWYCDEAHAQAGPKTDA
ncbi:MAG: hypothetical protein ACKO3C_04090 [Betaproteobacteria bacterium]